MALSKQDLERTEQQLVALRSDLQAQEKFAKENPESIELDQTKVGRLSRMDAMQSQQMALAASRRRQEQLSRIAGSLRRLESEDYGYCFVCDELIDPRRLAIDPCSTRCLKCAQG